MTLVHDLASMLALEPAGEGSYRAQNLESPAPVVFGGQILAQSVMAASASAPGKAVLSLHTVFARGASPDAPLEIDVETVSDGRTVASRSVTVRQGERTCARSVALLHVPEDDLIRHASPPPRPLSMDGTQVRDGWHPWWEVAVVDDVDLLDPAAVGPAELLIWNRFGEVPDGEAAQQAMLAFASDGFLIATAMRPHEGVGQAQSHQTISTSVITQTLSFHEPFDAGGWHLLAHRSPYAGRGRSYGQADVYALDGTMVASYTQDNIIRHMAEDRRPPAGERAKY